MESLATNVHGSRASECTNANRIVTKLTDGLTNNPMDKSALATACLALNDNASRWITLFCQKIIHLLLEDVENLLLFWGLIRCLPSTDAVTPGTARETDNTCCSGSTADSQRELQFGLLRMWPRIMHSYGREGNVCHLITRLPFDLHG